MKLMISKTDLAAYFGRIQSRIADAVEALRIAEGTLAETAAAYEDTHYCLNDADLWEAEFNARIFADLLQATISAKPSLPEKVFVALAYHPNQDPRNTPHLEAAIITLKLAERCLADALDLSEQLDGDEIDERYEVVYAARGVVRHYVCMLDSVAYVFTSEKALDAILARKRAPARAARQLVAA